MPLPDKIIFLIERVPRLPLPRRWRRHYGAAYATGPGPLRSARLRAALAESLAMARRSAARLSQPAAARGAESIALAPGLPPAAGKRAPGTIGLPALALRGLKAAFKFIVYAHIAFILATSLLVIVYSRVDPSVTVLMGYRKFASHFPVKKPVPVTAKQIGRYRRDILVRVEDWTFYTHHGFELAAIKNAARINKQIGRPMYGGSTLSMQTARTLFLVPFKSYFRKYLEAIVTVEIEAFLSKQRILELYYSYAEWGRGIFGIQAASLAYYGAPVSGISDEQYIRLVSLLSSPVRYTPTTLFKNRLLAWRYDFLMGRFLPATPDAKAAAAEATGAAPPALPQASPAPSPSISPAPNG
jgi:monofunctional glycosyltransferase